MSFIINKGSYSTTLDSSTLSANRTITFPDTSGTVMVSSGTGGNLIDMFYPVGTIYMTVNANFNPNTSWGGTWSKIENRFLYGSGSKSVGATGGEENVTLTTNQLPSHTHAGGTTEYTGSFTLGATLTGGPTEGVFNFGGRSGQVGTHPTIISGTNKMNFQASNGVSGESGATDNGESHNNMPPYEVVNIWKRTA